MMKSGVLRSIAHNLADSFASGCAPRTILGGEPLDIDIFAEADQNSENFITIDFLNGKILDGIASAEIAQAAALYASALPALCKSQGEDVSAFRELKARFSVDKGAGEVIIEIRDVNGKYLIDTYSATVNEQYRGSPLRRVN